MARLVTFVGLSLALAALATAQGIPDGAYCPTTTVTSTTFNQAILVNGMWLSILQNPLTSGQGTNCARLHRYTTDASGNVTLNEAAASSDCNTVSRFLVSSMLYDNVSNTIGAVMMHDSSTVYVLNYSATACTATGGGVTNTALAKGKYCGAFGDSIVAYANGMLWIKDTCVYTGTTYRMGNANQTQLSSYSSGWQTTSWCAGASQGSSFPTNQYVNYFAAANEFAVTYSNPSTRASVLSMANCLASTPDMDLPQNKTLCISAPGYFGDYNTASLIRVNATSFQMVLAQYQGGYSYVRTACVMTGSVSIRGSSLGLTFDRSTCSSAATITYAKILTDGSILFIDEYNNYFFAGVCPQTVVPNGVYCGGWNARLHVANTTFWLQTDSMSSTMMPSVVPATYAGTFIPQTDNSTLFVTSTQYSTSSGSTGQLTSINVMGSTVYVVVQRGYWAEGYAFQTDFCATGGVPLNATNTSMGWAVAPSAGVPAEWIPDTTTCGTVVGALQTFQSWWGSFSWTWNNSWTPGSLCTFAGTANVRAGQVSYRVYAANVYSCSSASQPLASSSSSESVLRNVVFSNGSLSYVFSNVSANASVMTSMCPMASNNSLPEGRYCLTGGMQTLTLNGTSALYLDTVVGCTTPLTITGVANGQVTLSRQGSYQYCQSVFSSSSTYTMQITPDGDLFLLSDMSSSASTGNLFSAAACSWNYTAPMVTAAATYCGAFPDGSRLSLAVEPVFQTLTAIYQQGSDNVCWYRGSVTARPQAFATSPMMYCNGSNYYIGQILRGATDASTLTVFLQSGSSNNWMNITLANGTCAGWQTGLESGQYCTPLGSTLAPVVVFGSYLLVSKDANTYIVNYSLPAGTNNVSINTAEVYGWTSGSWTRNAPNDLYVNTYGAQPAMGLTLSSFSYGFPFTIAATMGGCPWAWSNLTMQKEMVMTSMPLGEPFNGNVTAVFHYNGNFTMLLPNNQTSVASRCYAYGVYQVMPGNNQMTLQVTSSVNCNFAYEFSNATWNPTTNAVTFTLWYPWNSWTFVTLTEAQCSVNSPIPSGRYCNGNGAFGYVCNTDLFMFSAPSSMPVAIGNVSSNMNGTATYFSSASPSTPNLIEYVARNRSVLVTNWYSTEASYFSMDMCSLPWDMSDLAFPTVGMYCGTGSIAGTNGTAFVLPNGNLYLNLYPVPPNASSTSTYPGTGLCEIIGNIAYSTSTGLGWYATTIQSSSCRVDTYSSYSQPRVRVNSTWYNNQTGVLTIVGSTWSGPGGEGAPITYTLSAGASCVSLGQSQNASLVYYPRGVYGVNAAGLNVTTLVLGTRYALYASNALSSSLSSSVGVLGGMYTANTLSAVQSNAGLTPTLRSRFQSYIVNSTFVPGYLQMSPAWAYSSGSDANTGHMTLPLGYWGLDPAAGGNAVPPPPNGPNGPNSASGDSDDKKSNTGIIIGVIVAVVVVVAIIAVIAMRMKSSSSAPAGKDDHYTSMNAV